MFTGSPEAADISDIAISEGPDKRLRMQFKSLSARDSTANTSLRVADVITAGTREGELEFDKPYRLTYDADIVLREDNKGEPFLEVQVTKDAPIDAYVLQHGVINSLDSEHGVLTDSAKMILEANVGSDPLVIARNKQMEADIKKNYNIRPTGSNAIG